MPLVCAARAMPSAEGGTPPVAAAAGGRGPGGVAEGLRGEARGGPETVLRLRRLALGPPPVTGSGKPRGGEPRRGPVPRGPKAPVAGGGMAPGEWDPADPLAGARPVNAGGVA